MLATYIQSRTTNPALIRILTIVGFVALTALCARVTIELAFTPVPITLQVLAVLLAGLALGAKDGAASQVVYVAAITAGLPLDADGLGAAVWARPSAGYLIGFIFGACVAGYLAERGLQRSRALRFMAGLAGVAAIYLVGAAWLTLGFLGGDWSQGWALGVAPFIIVDVVKALIASGVAEGINGLFNGRRPDRYG
ncbi:MAG TPA: biotin transporter BioY [Anaerolineae bacterium]|nr:biotin transporter BioY [Anaerolineae bacterium]